MTAAPVNVAAHLSLMAAREPARPAVILPRFAADGSVRTEQMTFRELDEDSGHIAHGLQSLGITASMRTALMVPPSLDFFSLTFALFKLGAVPVLIDPGMGIRNLGVCLGEAEPEAFIGIPKAHLARRVLGWGRKTIRHTVTTGSRFFGGRHSLRKVRSVGRQLGPLTVADSAPDDMAAILFTSGSTGIAKGVVYRHRIFAAQVELLKAVYGIQPGEIDLCTFPLFALFAPALGMTAVIPEMDPRKPAEVDAKKIVAAVHHFQVTNMFGSPALINRVGRYALEHDVKLPTVRRVISAGAPVPASVIERFTKTLNPGVQVFTPYGATESLPVANIGSDTILNETRAKTDIGKGVCVGFPVPGMTVRIVRISDGPMPTFTDADCLPAGEIGEIAVNGPVVTEEYFGRPSATALAKMRDGDGKLWHRMGDVGYCDEQGRIWFCGRKSHRVVISGSDQWAKTPPCPPFPRGGEEKPDTVDGYSGGIVADFLPPLARGGGGGSNPPETCNYEIDRKAADPETLFTIPVEAIFNTHPDVFRSALVAVKHRGFVGQDDITLPTICVELEPGVNASRWPEIQEQLKRLAQQFDHTRKIVFILRHPKFPVDIRHNAKIFREKLAVWATGQFKEGPR